MSDSFSPQPTIEKPEPELPRFDEDKRGTLRALVEAFVSLFVAVLLFRTFAAEGYMISTGSMAPSLLGYHKRVICPTCGITFPFGTAYDTDDDPDAVITSRSRAICPNCGQPGIDVSDVPRNHGDQLLVNKQAYLYQSPNRWDVVVFRNPARPTEAYVKRIAGLPGERIQITGGDVIVDGQIARKTFSQQLATRILVDDQNFRPARDEAYRSHWQIIAPDPADPSTQEDSSWTANTSSFRMRSDHVRRPDNHPISWVEYHHWIRSGGMQETSVPLVSWPEDLDPRSVPNSGLRFEPATHQFSVTGALPIDVARQLIDLSEEEPFQAAVRDLDSASHIVPVMDHYGYNPDEEIGTPNPVRDLMISSRIFVRGGAGQFLMEMTDGATRFTLMLDALRRQISLFVDPLLEGQALNSANAEFGPRSDPVASVPWPVQLEKRGVTVEFSLIDKQVLVAVDGKELFPAWTFEFPAGVAAPRIPVRFGARGLDVEVGKLRLYRDIYYTDSRSRHAINRPYSLKENEFFVLGDNSPVSHDSRRWENPVVHRSYLVGKPFLVHLPSKPGNLRIGSRELYLRMPDWERIRFLR
jgi:signal peptidase I